MITYIRNLSLSMVTSPDNFEQLFPSQPFAFCDYKSFEICALAIWDIHCQPHDKYFIAAVEILQVKHQTCSLVRNAERANLLLVVRLDDIVKKHWHDT